MSTLIPIDQTASTKEEMQARVKLLSQEIVANEEENRMMQDEINELYAKIDALK